MGGPSSALLKLMHLLAYLIVKTRYGTMSVVLVTAEGPQRTVSTEGGGGGGSQDWSECWRFEP